jgi:type IV pilus assembly protein PilY1
VPTGGTVIYPITNSADDANQDNTDMMFDGPLWVGSGSTPPSSLAGLRFRNINIPRGAVIDEAYLVFYSASGQWITLNLQYAGDAADNSQPFTSGLLSQRTLTNARVSDSSDVPWYANNAYPSVSLKTIVQEIVNRNGWQAGNSLSIIIRNTSGNPWARKFAYSYEQNPQAAAQLVIQWH